MFARRFPWFADRDFLWAVKLFGSLTVEKLRWEHFQMKQWDVWNAQPTGECRVTHLLWPPGVLNCKAARAHTHTHRHTKAYRSSTVALWCYLHLSQWRMVESWKCACVCFSSGALCSVRTSTPAFFFCFFFYELVLVERRADKDARSLGATFKLRVLDVRCNVPPQVDEIECIIPAYEGLALK